MEPQVREIGTYIKAPPDTHEAYLAFFGEHDKPWANDGIMTAVAYDASIDVTITSAQYRVLQNTDRPF